MESRTAARVPVQRHAPGPVSRSDPAWHVLQERLTVQWAEIRIQEQQIRRGEPEGVHKMRVAMRRTRSLLTTYQRFFEADAAAPLIEDLRWAGNVLGGARDAEVIRGRLHALIERLPADDDTEAGDRVARRLDAAEQTSRDESLSVLDSERYQRMLSSLDDLVEHPRWSSVATRPGDEVLRRPVRRDWKRVRRRAERARRAQGDQDQAAALHDVRKAAKRLRYAGETLAPVYGARAQRLARAAEEVQTELGEHHDSVTAQAVLRGLSQTPDVDTAEAFTLGRLDAREEVLAAQAAARYEDAWHTLSRKRMRAWLH
jgi:CHAD domain-containing protein